MAITLDSSTDLGISTSGSGAQSITTAHTVSGSDTILLVGTSSSSANGSTSITGITYNGVSMTRVTTDIQIPSNSYLGLWYLLNPASGTHNVVVSVNQTGTGRAWAGAVSYTGVLQSSQPNAFNTGTTTAGTSLTVSVTTSVDNCKLVGNMGSRLVGSVTAGTNTQVVKDYGQASIIDSPTAQTPAGSKSLTGTEVSSDNFAGVIVALAPIITSSTFIPKIIII